MIFRDREYLFRILGVMGALFAVAILAVDWLRTTGFGPKGSSLAILGILVAFVPLFRSRKFEQWHICPKNFLAVLLILAAIINVFLMIRNPNIGNDALWFHSAFHNLIAGKGWGNIYLPWHIVEPGYGMLSYPFYLLTDNIELSGMLVSAISYLLIIPTAFYAARFLFGLRSALYASALIAIWPALISFSYVSLSDVAFAFFLLLSFNFYIKILIDDNSLFRGAMLGFTLGMAYLLRESEGLMVAGLVILSLFAVAIIDLLKRESKLSFISRLQPWLTAFASTLVFSLAVIFYSTLIHSATGYWTISTRLIPVYESIPSTPVATEPNQDSLIASTPIPSETQAATTNDNNQANSTEVSQDASAAPTTPDPKLTQMKIEGRGVDLDWVVLQNNLVDLMVNKTKAITHAWLPFFMIGSVFILLPTRKTLTSWKINPRRVRIALAFSIYLSPLIPLLFLQGDRGLRYFLSDYIYLLILIAFFTIRLLERVLESVGRKFFDKGLFLICLISLITVLGIGSPTFSDVISSAHAHTGLRAAGLWFRDNLPNPDEITIWAPRKGQVAIFYAAGQEFVPGQAREIAVGHNLVKVGEIMNSGKFDYLLLDNHYVHSKPHLEILWNKTDLAREFSLSLLYRDPDELFQVYIAEKYH